MLSEIKTILTFCFMVLHMSNIHHCLSQNLGHSRCSIDIAWFDSNQWTHDTWSHRFLVIFLGSFVMFLPCVNSKGSIDCKIMYWKSTYYCREKNIPGKVLFSFWSWKNRTMVKGFTKRRCGTQITIWVSPVCDSAKRYSGEQMEYLYIRKKALARVSLQFLLGLGLHVLQVSISR